MSNIPNLGAYGYVGPKIPAAVNATISTSGNVASTTGSLGRFLINLIGLILILFVAYWAINLFLSVEEEKQKR